MPEQNDGTEAKVVEEAGATSTQAAADDRTDEERTVTEAEVPAAPQVADGRDFRLPGNDTSGYVGVSPEYRNYADGTHRPILTDAERERMEAAGLRTDDQLAAYPAEPAEREDVEKVETDTPDDAGEGQADAGVASESEGSSDAGTESQQSKTASDENKDDTFLTDL